MKLVRIRMGWAGWPMCSKLMETTDPFWFSPGMEVTAFPSKRCLLIRDLAQSGTPVLEVRMLSPVVLQKKNSSNFGLQAQGKCNVSQQFWKQMGPKKGRLRCMECTPNWTLKQRMSSV